MKREFGIFLLASAVVLFSCLSASPNSSATAGKTGKPSSENPATATIANTRTHTPTQSRSLTPTIPATETPSAAPAEKYYLADCWDNAISQLSMNECALKQQEASYQALQRLLAEIQHNMDSDTWNILANAQKDWEAFRLSDCEVYKTIYSGGSIVPMMYQLCLDGHNVTRIKELKYFACPGYGRSGSCDASDTY